MQRNPSFILDQVFTSAQVNSIQDSALGIAQVPGLRLGPPYVSSSNGTVLNIGAMAFAMLSNANTTLTKADATYTPTSPALVANTWYYLYVYSNAGVLTVEHDVVEPSSSLAFKSGDTARLYIGCFRTNVSGVILPFWKAGNEVVYRRSAGVVVSNDFAVSMSGGHATSFADLSLAPWVPPHSRIAMIEGIFEATVAFDEASLITKGDTGTFFHRIKAVEIGDEIYKDFTIITSEQQEISYMVSDADDTLQINACGFIE